jgi:hypothetical protein
MMLEATDQFKNPSWALLQASLDYTTRLSEFALINSGCVFECARKLSSVTSSSEFADVVTNHTRDQFDAFSEQVEELSALIQKVSRATAEEAEFSLGD